MITFIVHLTTKPENALELEAMMAHVQAMTLKNEPGVVHYGFAKSADAPDTYVVVEVYRDAAAHAAHMAAAWVKESLPRSAQLIEGKPEVRQYVVPGTEPAVRQTEF